MKAFRLWGKRGESYRVGAQHSTQCTNFALRDNFVGSVAPASYVVSFEKRSLTYTKNRGLGYRVLLLFLLENMRGNNVGVTVPNKLRVPRCYPLTGSSLTSWILTRSLYTRSMKQGIGGKLLLNGIHLWLECIETVGGSRGK